MDTMQNSSGSTSSERRRRRGLLGGLKKGVGRVWEKIVADHPEPLRVDRVRQTRTGRV